MIVISPLDRGRRRLLNLVVAVFVLGAAACALVVLLWEAGTKPSRFDADAWRASRGAPYTDRTRLRMVDDLLESGRLLGMPRAAAVSLLGEADDTAEFFRGRTLTWYVGPAGGFIPIDNLRLRLTFDRGGHVVSADTFQR